MAGAQQGRAERGRPKDDRQPQGFFGSEVQRLQRGRDEVRVWVRYDRSDRSDLTDLNGNAMPEQLSLLAEVR